MPLATKQPQTYVLDRAATGIGRLIHRATKSVVTYHNLNDINEYFNCKRTGNKVLIFLCLYC